ncbi:MAG: metallophosphatase family protein [Planctomycetes bacterium]|nr:metallophosphatase family protein [Planctomycetota bacterium]
MGERIAFVSDIHSNLEALTAVMRDIEAKRCKRIYCLGDLIGYGPNPNECIDIAMRSFELVINGNHDEAISYKIPKRFKRLAAKAAFWTRRRVKPGGKFPGANGPEQRQRWAYLRDMPDTYALGPWLLAHGSPESNLDYVHDAVGALDVFQRLMGPSRLCFLGHTHVPGIFLLDRTDVHYVEPEEGKRYAINGHRAIVNVGSVGQPRDGDPRACWVLAREDGSFSFRRVEYDIDATADKIVRARGLHKSLAERLYLGE